MSVLRVLNLSPRILISLLTLALTIIAFPAGQGEEQLASLEDKYVVLEYTPGPARASLIAHCFVDSEPCFLTIDPRAPIASGALAVWTESNGKEGLQRVAACDDASEIVNDRCADGRLPRPADSRDHSAAVTPVLP